MRKTMKLEIPVGKTLVGDIYEIKLCPNIMMNCYITGQVGSGKTNLLRAIIKNTLNKYDDVNIWILSCETREFSDLLFGFRECVFDINIDSEKTALDAVSKLYCELDARIKMLREYGVNSFEELDNDIVETRLLVVIDDFQVIDQVLSDNLELKHMFERVLIFGRAVGISLVLTSQLPKNQCKGLSLVAQDLIRMPIFLKTRDLFDAFWVGTQRFGANENQHIFDHFKEIGAFVAIDRPFDGNEIIYGKVEYTPYGQEM